MLATKSLIVGLLHISVIKDVLISVEVVNVAQDAATLNCLVPPFPLRSDTSFPFKTWFGVSHLTRLQKRLWCFWQMLIEKALKAKLHCNQKKITEV